MAAKAGKKNSEAYLMIHTGCGLRDGSFDRATGLFGGSACDRYRPQRRYAGCSQKETSHQKQSLGKDSGRSAKRLCTRRAMQKICLLEEESFQVGDRRVRIEGIWRTGAGLCKQMYRVLKREGRVVRSGIFHAAGRCTEKKRQAVLVGVKGYIR